VANTSRLANPTKTDTPRSLPVELATTIKHPLKRQMESTGMIDVQKRRDPLHELVESALSTSPFVPRRGLDFEASEGSVTLRGRVGTFFQKQMAQEAVRRVDGVERVENHLEVNWT
jgi:osmotically-inducible protein OsmY